MAVKLANNLLMGDKQITVQKRVKNVKIIKLSPEEEPAEQ
jgi:hypothetical protein